MPGTKRPRYARAVAAIIRGAVQYAETMGYLPEGSTLAVSVILAVAFATGGDKCTYLCSVGAVATDATIGA